jgi:hypothetical protein
MPATVWKVLNKNSPGTASTFAADDWDMPGRYMHDVDLSATDPSSIKTNTSFWDNRLRFWNPAKTFSYRLRASAILANYDVTLPLITSNDDFMLLLATQTPQNKTINLSNNTLTATGATAGGLPSHNGTKYVNKALGTAGQVPTVNAGGTDWTWAAASSTNIADNAVTTAKIVDAAVTNAKLAGSIQGNKLLDNSITDAKLTQITDKTKLPSDINYTGSTAIHTGSLNPKHATEHSGMLSGICVAPAGQTFAASQPTTGSQAAFTTGSTSGNQAGFRTTENIGERSHNPFNIECRFSLNATTTIRGFIGFVDDKSAFRSGGDMLNAKSGVGIAWDSATFGNFKIAHNDGVGATVFDDWSTPKALDTSGHTFTIQANNASSRFELYIDGLTVSNLTTDIPSSGTEMALQCYVETSSAATKQFFIKFLVIKDSVAD